MKKIFSLLVVVLALVSCNEEENSVRDIRLHGFWSVLLPYGDHSNYERLNNDQIVEYNYNPETKKEYNVLYRSCKLVKNDNNYLQYLCDSYRKEGDWFAKKDEKKIEYEKKYKHLENKDKCFLGCEIVHKIVNDDRDNVQISCHCFDYFEILKKTETE